MYLVAILPWFSRLVTARELDQVLESPCVLKAVGRALQQAQPAILNGGQGSHFTGLPYPERVLAVGVRISTDGRCREMDSIFAERLWRSVIYEEVYLDDSLCPREARQGLSRYSRTHSHERPHWALDYRMPAGSYVAKDQAVV